MQASQKETRNLLQATVEFVVDKLMGPISNSCVFGLFGYEIIAPTPVIVTSPPKAVEISGSPLTQSSGETRS